MKVPKTQLLIVLTIIVSHFLRFPTTIVISVHKLISITKRYFSLGTLSRLDEFLLNPLTQNHSESALETSWNALCTKQGTNEDDSQSDLHLEASFSKSQTTPNSDPDDGYDRSLVFRCTFLK